MPKHQGRHPRNILRKYELGSLLFLLSGIVTLGVIVSLVFRSYSTSGKSDSAASEQDVGILSEDVVPESSTCVFQVGTTLYAVSRRYQSQREAPITDDGFIRELFAIPGVVEVVVGQRMVVITKSPSAYWNHILPGARAVINKHLHMHP